MTTTITQFTRVLTIAAIFAAFVVLAPVPVAAQNVSGLSLQQLIELVNKLHAQLGQQSQGSQSPVVSGVVPAQVSWTKGPVIDFGDGTQIPLTRLHKYSRTGTYTASLHRDGAKGEVVAQTRVFVVDRNQTGTNGLKADRDLQTFISAIGNAPLTSEAYIDWGDGTKTSLSDLYRYEKPGTYTLSWRATGNEVGASVRVTVSSLASSTPAAIQVTAPNGGERWELGVQNTVTWTPYGYSPDINAAKDVTVYLERTNGTRVGQILDTGKASLHTYLNINNYDTWATPGQYYVRVVNNKTGASDRSDAPFTVLPRSADLKVNGSDSRVEVTNNQRLTVSWTTANHSFTSCRLEGVRDTVGGVASINNLPTSGSRTVYAVAPAPGSSAVIGLRCYTSTATEKTDYVGINGKNQPVATSTVRIMSPNGGERIQVGTPYTITFSTSGVDKYSLALYSNDKFLQWISRDILAGKEGHIWTPSKEAVGANFKIYITALKSDGSGYVDDKSDQAFTIVNVATSTPPAPAAMSISSFTATPASVKAGQTVTFRWASTGTEYCNIRSGTGNNFGTLVVDKQPISGSYVADTTTSLTYVLSCYSPARNGTGVEKRVNVTVAPATPVSSSTTPVPKAPSATSTPTNTSTLQVSCVPSPSQVAVAKSANVTWKATASGGVGSYTYFFEGSDGVKSTGYWKDAVYPTYYTSAGTKEAWVTVRSGNETKKAKCSQLTVTATVSSANVPQTASVFSALQQTFTGLIEFLRGE